MVKDLEYCSVQLISRLVIVFGIIFTHIHPVFNEDYKGWENSVNKQTDGETKYHDKINTSK